MENKELDLIVEKHKQMLDQFESNIKKICDDFKTEMAQLVKDEKSIKD